MRKNELRARSAVKRDLAAIALPTKLQLQKIISELQNLVYSALRTGETTDIEKVCQERLLALLDAGTEVAVLKGGRRGQLSSEKVIDEPISEIMPVRFSLQDKGTVQAQGTAKYLRRISGIDPTRTNNEFRKQNAVLINGLSKEICDTVRKTIVDLTKLGVHVRGGKKEISDILLNAGLDPAATPRLAETIFRTQTAAAYNAGRWNIVNDSDTAPYIWGFQYCTAHDRRVRPEHRLLEGVRLPKDDPFWKRYFPPNGWNCRCTVLEIWNDEEMACEDFGITGVDPRKRSPKELNLLPAFDGNVGILGYGRGGFNAQSNSSKGGNNNGKKPTTPIVIENIPAPAKPEENIPVEDLEKAKVYDRIETDIHAFNQKTKSEKMFMVFVEPMNEGKEFEITDWKRTVLGNIYQGTVSFSVLYPRWRVVVGRTKEYFKKMKDAIDCAISEIARQYYSTTKDRIRVEWRNKFHSIEKPEIIDDWKAFRKACCDEFKRTFAEENGKLSPDDNPGLISREDYAVIENSPLFLNWKIAKNRMLSQGGGVWYMRDGKNFRTWIEDRIGEFYYPDIENVVKAIINRARDNGFRYFSYNKTAQVVFEKTTGDVYATILNSDFSGGFEKVSVFVREDDNDITIVDNNTTYRVTYSRPRNSFIVKEENTTGVKIIMEGDSIINLIYKFLEKIKNESQHGIFTEINFNSRGGKAIAELSGVTVRPYQDRILQRTGIQPNDSDSEITNKVISYINKLTPTKRIRKTTRTDRQCKDTLFGLGIQVQGNPCHDSLAIQTEVAEFLEANEFSPSLRRFGKLPSNDDAEGRATSGLRLVQLKDKSRAEWEEEVKEQADNDWWTPGDERHVFIHEDTHQLMNDICDILGKDRLDLEFQSILDTIGAGLYHADVESSNPPVLVWKNETMDSLHEFYKNHKTKKSRNNFSQEELDKWNYIDKIIKEFCIYGASYSNSGTRWQEACAEARADVLNNGKAAKPFSKKIYAIIVKLYLEAQTKGVQS